LLCSFLRRIVVGDTQIQVMIGRHGLRQLLNGAKTTAYGEVSIHANGVAMAIPTSFGSQLRGTSAGGIAISLLDACAMR